MAGKDVVIYYLLEDEPIDNISEKTDTNSQIFDIIKSDMTRNRWLEKIQKTYPKFMDIVNQLKKWYKVVSIWCWEKKVEEDILEKHPEIEIYGIDLKDFNPESKIPVLEQDLLEWIHLPKKTSFVYSFYTLQYLPNPLKTVEEIYDQLPNGAVAILHMWPKGIFDPEIGKYINKHNKEVHREKTNKEELEDWYIPGDYIIIHKNKWWEKIKLPVTKAKKLHKIATTDGRYIYENNNWNLMFSIDFDEIGTTIRDQELHP